jgi:hypothetical protein
VERRQGMFGGPSMKTTHEGRKSNLTPAPTTRQADFPGRFSAAPARARVYNPAVFRAPKIIRR